MHLPFKRSALIFSWKVYHSTILEFQNTENNMFANAHTQETSLSEDRQSMIEIGYIYQIQNSASFRFRTYLVLSIYRAAYLINKLHQQGTLVRMQLIVSLGVLGYGVECEFFYFVNSLFI